MPSASNNNQSNTKLVKQSSVNSMNSGGPSGTSSAMTGGVGVGVGGKGNSKKVTENSSSASKSNQKNSNNGTTTGPSVAPAVTNSNGSGNVETSSIKSAKETAPNSNNGIAATAATSVASLGQNGGKNWETNSAAGGNSNAPSTTTTTNNKDAAANDALNPMKLTFTTIEHKIRNLEKRKAKLEGYRAIAALGKELSSDQKAAVDKYDAVIATLEFARDLVKQMQQFTKDAEKEQKKQARKDLIAKAQAETVKIREVLIIQNILSCFTDDAVRSDFLNGEHGAAKLEQNEMDIIEKFCVDVQTRRPETADDAPFATSAQKAAEIFSMTIDARPKAYGETTYESVKRIFHRIQESDYLDKIYLTDVPEPEEIKEDGEERMEDEELEENEIVVPLEQQQGINDQEEANGNVDALEDGIEKMNIVENNTATGGMINNELNENIMVVQQQQQQQQQHPLHHPQQQQQAMHPPPQPQQQQQQQQLNEQHIEIPQQQQAQAPQVPLQNMANVGGQPLMTTSMAPPASAVPAFQPSAPGPAPGHSGATTPVHVAMYSIPNMQTQLTPQQLQQLPPAQGLMGAGVQNSGGPVQQHVANIPPQQQQQPNAAGGPPPPHGQQRQMLGSPANTGAPVNAMATPMQQAPPPPPGIYNPTPVHAVEQTYFKQHATHPQQQQQQQQHQQQHQQQQQQQQQQHQQYLQQMRPLAEVIGGGNFYFLQDSELDSPELNAQGQAGPQTTMIFEQQQQQQPVMQPQQQPPQQQMPSQQLLQNLQQQKASSNEVLSNGVVPNAATAPQGSLPHQQQQQQQQQQQAPPHLQQNLSQTAPIQTQTFTNQSFPHITAAAQQQQQQQQQASSTPSPLFHQQQQQQQQMPPQQPVPTQKPQPQPQQQQLFSPVQGQQTPTQMLMSGSVDVQQPALMLMNRLGAGNPQNPLMQQQHQQHLQQHQQHQQLQQQMQQPQALPPQALMQQQQQQQQPVANTPQNLINAAGMHQMPPPQTATDLSQSAPKGAGFPFDNPVMTGLNSYEQQLQSQQMQNQLNNAANVLKKSLGVRGAGEDDSKPPVIQKSDLINEWSQDNGTAKIPTNVVANNANSSSNSSSNDFNNLPEANKWTTTATANSTPSDVNANNNSPLTPGQATVVPTQHQQAAQRKNEWTSTATTTGSSGVPVDNYGNDNRSAEPNNHWHTQDSQSGYGRNSANRQSSQQGGGGGGNAMGGGGAQGNTGGGYQRRNDDRRGGDDRRPGGGNSNQGGGGGYRGRSNYNAGGPQQNGNGGGRGGNSSGIYFRNNDNNSSGSYYQNGGSGGGGGGSGGGNVYPNKDGGSRYESGGPGQYRGPRTAANNTGNPRSSGPPPRHMSGGGGGGRSGGQPNNNANSNSYINSRQATNRMTALGLDNKQ